MGHGTANAERSELKIESKEQKAESRGREQRKRAGSREQ
jgi:hypothetical protein